MNAVGIDVSKSKSMVAIMRPFGEIIKRKAYGSREYEDTFRI